MCMWWEVQQQSPVVSIQVDSAVLWKSPNPVGGAIPINWTAIYLDSPIQLGSVVYLAVIESIISLLPLLDHHGNLLGHCLRARPEMNRLSNIKKTRKSHLSAPNVKVFTNPLTLAKVFHPLNWEKHSNFVDDLICPMESWIRDAPMKFYNDRSAF